MTTRPLIVFDGDDTLWRTEALYDAARAACADVVAAVGLDGREWEGRQRALDLKRMESLGFSRERFPGSCVLAAQALAAETGLDLAPPVLSQLKAEASAVFQRKAALAPGVDEVLHLLSGQNDLALLTQGDPDVQQRRIADSGLRRRFASVHIVDLKSDRVFMRLAQSGQPRARLSVGNSLASDINPAMRTGYAGVWLAASGAWSWEEREDGSSPRLGELYVTDSLLDVPTLVEMWSHAKRAQLV